MGAASLKGVEGDCEQRALLDFLVPLLPIPLARQRFFRALLLAGLQIERVPLDLLNDVLLLNLSLKSPQGAL